MIDPLDVESEHPNAFNTATQNLFEECAVRLRSSWMDNAQL